MDSVLTLVRHPETLANLARVRQGSTDSPLSARGEAQLKALAQLWEASASSVPITLVASSPLTRARRVGEALVARSAPSNATNSPATSPPNLTLRQDLAEQSFGPQENYKAGKHVPEFPRGQGPYESRNNFQARVRREGSYWLGRMVEALHDQSTASDAPQGRSPKRARVDHGLFSSSSNERDEKTSSTSSAIATMPTSSPHYVLITHGLWLSTFMHLFVPPQTGERIPFASNTGVFTLKITLLQDNPPTTSKPPSSVLSLPPSNRPPQVTRAHKRGDNGAILRYTISITRANALDHLAGVQNPPQAERKKKVELDPKQRRLDSFFAKKPRPP